jgi:hypothetical protein
MLQVQNLNESFHKHTKDKRLILIFTQKYVRGKKANCPKKKGKSKPENRKILFELFFEPCFNETGGLTSTLLK